MIKSAQNNYTPDHHNNHAVKYVDFKRCPRPLVLLSANWAHKSENLHFFCSLLFHLFYIFLLCIAMSSLLWRSGFFMKWKTFFYSPCPLSLEIDFFLNYFHCVHLLDMIFIVDDVPPINFVGKKWFKDSSKLYNFLIEI